MQKMQNNITPLFLVLFLIINLSLHVASDYDTPLHYMCSASSTYDSDNAFESNLSGLFSSFSSEATALQGTFLKNTTGTGPEQVSGLVLCRGDVSSFNCSDCIEQSFRKMTDLCAGIKEGIIWYDFCLLQYSYNQSILAISTDNSLRFSMWNAQNMTDDKFNGYSNITIMSSVNTTLLDLLSRVSNHASFSTNRFATGVIYTEPMPSSNGAVGLIISLPPIYALSQCRPDLSNEACQACLQDLVDQILETFSGSQGGRIVGVQCNLRYEIYSFFSGDPIVALGPIPSPETTNAPSSQSPLMPPASNSPPTSAPLPSKPPASSSTHGSKKGGMSQQHIIVISVVAALFVLGCLIGIFWIRKFGYADIQASQEDQTLTQNDEILDLWTGERSSDVPLFDFNQLVNAATNFSTENKLCRGGFGPVYKGVLLDGLAVAVKRLSVKSSQGLIEFRNEIKLIAKLQHQNLVRLVGWCIYGEEKLLVYEFMPNKSLDFFIFGK